MIVLEKILDFLVRYWAYLVLVSGSLILLVIISVVLNARARVRNEEPTEDPEPIPEPAKEPLIEVVEAEVMNPDHVSVPETETPEPEISPEVPLTPSPQPPAETILQNPVAEPLPETVALDEPAPETPKPEKLPPKPKKNLGKYHVMYRSDGKWYVKREGSTAILRVLETQKEALSWAIIKAYPQNIAIVVHDKDGKIKKTELL